MIQRGAAIDSVSDEDDIYKTRGKDVRPDMAAGGFALHSLGSGLMCENAEINTGGQKAENPVPGRLGARLPSLCRTE